jgi:hypothetical protein
MVATLRRRSIMQRTLVALAVVLAPLVAPAQAKECPPCGPRFCTGDPDADRAREWKKQRLHEDGYPDRLVELVDRIPACVGCIVDAPDGFQVRVVRKGGQVSLPWTREVEKEARDDLRAGRARVVCLVNSARACACCNEPASAERDDWDKSLELNTKLADCFHSAEEAGADPDDLAGVDLRAAASEPKPAPKPEPAAVPEAHPACASCDAAAAEHNHRAQTLNQDVRKLTARENDQALLDWVVRQALRAADAWAQSHGSPSKKLEDALGTAAAQAAQAAQSLDGEAKAVRRDRFALALADQALADCARACAAPPPQQQPVAPVEQASPAAAKGWRPHGTANVGFGGTLGLYQAGHQLVVGAIATLGVPLPSGLLGSVVFAPSVGVIGGAVLLTLPVGFQLDFRLPVPNLFLYARLMLGYGGLWAMPLAFPVCFGCPNPVTTLSSYGVVEPVAGLRYVLKEHWTFGADLVSLPFYFTAPNSAGFPTFLLWKLFFYAGYAF